MKTRIYITALLTVIAMTADAQDYYRRESISPHSSVPQTGRNLQQEWGYWDIYPKKTLNRSFLQDDCYDRIYYPYYVAVKSLAVRSAPSYDAPILTTVSQGEVIHLTGDQYPWKSMRVTYFDSDAWAYRTTVGYVNSQLVRSPTPSSANRTGSTAPTYADPFRGQSTRTESRPIIDRTYTDRTIIVKRSSSERKGRVAIWTNCEDDGYIDVYIDGDYAGKLTTSFYGTAPVCGEEGTIVRELPAGKHDISAFGSTRMWNMEAEVLPGQCTLKLLSRGGKE
ncbi:MAG: SH3 domain-containing protein [Tannerella sp.]|jgi:uncharacterized protein YgiM (DUF1202 family)|nr:SH3 domain-containing protein [Tannerella sp.]